MEFLTGMRLMQRVICWVRGHRWEARGGSFGTDAVQVCQRCGMQGR